MDTSESYEVVGEQPGVKRRRGWPREWIDEVAWAIHGKYPCDVCVCGDRRCPEPRFLEVVAAMAVLSKLSDLGAVDAPWEIVP